MDSGSWLVMASCRGRNGHAKAADRASTTV
jgi:hypothetical protein